MSPEEKTVIAGIFDRLKAAANQPRDPQAEAFIAEQIKAQPYAPYVMAQSIYAQEQALINMNAQMEQMQARLQQLEAYVQQVQNQPQGGGFLGGLFGGGRPAAPPPPPGLMGQQAMPGRAPFQHGPMGAPAAAGPWGQQAQQQRQGMGFLGTAAMTAAGVAGGILAANAISNMFGGGQAQAAPAAPADAGFQPASYAEPSHGADHHNASYDDGGDFGGGDDWA